MAHRYGNPNYLSRLEPETINALKCMTLFPDYQWLIDYDNLIKGSKQAFGLSTGSNNFSSAFQTFSICCAHEPEVVKINWADITKNATEHDGVNLFEPFLGIKSSGASYMTWPGHASSVSSNQTMYWGAYLMEDINNASGYYFGHNDNITNRGYLGTFTSNTSHTVRRTTTLNTSIRQGLKRHATSHCISNSQTTTGELYINGNLAVTGSVDNWTQFQSTQTFLCRNNDTVKGDFFTNYIGFFYVTQNNLSPDLLAFHNALEGYLTSKGITGL